MNLKTNYEHLLFEGATLVAKGAWRNNCMVAINIFSRPNDLEIIIFTYLCMRLNDAHCIEMVEFSGSI